ncbi:MAG: ATP-dependent Clp protease adaptor ClpS [Cyclobacteriaceae bacterium]|nr:ATP-dependent Clp protease adaptor ClpS [Cyclobacteriaceae bacterium]
MSPDFQRFHKTNEEVEVDVLLEEEEHLESKLIVYNDDINTFDHVINTLIKVCKHSPEQAEQCTWIIHFKGKCCVKIGERVKLEAMCSAIHDKGINADVE